ncbi:purine-nucleoside phosphorylase [Desulfatibacillum alkenivorans DSM 16219]|jgi:purine-nucleoside phosphorylase|uniref:Purine nucleoside phosphorylase n=1 Tax=Desulfatibacillum alkenivorans DSM 16219 TaxID=1121393 RepID=A0A1M6QPZ2_9BACT|nr:purine-nucleoside phosphorylase [Desulfatibacillum alkenivorans]SHK22087.1 purine-nucleoside phosphorylase [Desulfatibacillum alkenivorans DSM 16219]
MTVYKEQVEQAAAWIRERFGRAPAFGFIFGTGLGASVQTLKVETSLDYADIPNFPVSTVQSHEGRLLCGTAGDQAFVALQGRFHLYEGYSAKQITFPIRVMQELGVKTLIFASAVGGLNPEFTPGDIMIVEDHINLSGENPLVGENVDSWGVRFPEMFEAYDNGLIQKAQSASEKLDIPLRRGVYVGLKGPSLETPAEMRFLRAIGADAVGLSTVNEVIAAVHGGMKVLGFAIITNVNVPGMLTPASIDEIVAVADAASPRVGAIINRVLQNL